MSSLENCSLGQAMLDQYQERQFALDEMAAADRALQVERLVPFTHPLDALANAALEFGITDMQQVDLLDADTLSAVAKQVLAAHFAEVEKEALQENLRLAALRAQFVAHVFHLFVSEQVGKVVTIGQIDRTAEPSVSVYIPEFKGNHTFDEVFSSDDADMVDIYLENRKPNYRLHETIGIIHAVTGYRKQLILTTTPDDPMTSEKGLIVADVLDESANPKIAINFN